MPFVCIGDSRSIPMFLRALPEETPLIHLKLDGTQVWPPQNLTHDEVLRRCVECLERLCAGRVVALFGFSSGGFLAYCLAEALRARCWDDVKAVLIEPTQPRRYDPWRIRLRTLARSVRARWRSRSGSGRASTCHVEASWRTPEPTSEAPAMEDRWRRMEPRYLRLVDATRLRPAARPVALVVGRDYAAAYGRIWERLGSAGLATHVLEDADGTFRGFRSLTWNVG